MIVSDLLRAGSESRITPGMLGLLDPLLWEDLEEGQLLDIRILTSTHTVGLLIDIRNSMGLDQYNTAVLVVRNATDIGWKTEDSAIRSNSKFYNTTLFVNMLASFNVVKTNGSYEFYSKYSVGSAFRAQGTSGAMFFGNVEGILPEPPDLGDGRELIYSNGFQDWNREIVLGEFCQVGA